jgi:hypothetical protein
MGEFVGHWPACGKPRVPWAAPARPQKSGGTQFSQVCVADSTMPRTGSSLGAATRVDVGVGLDEGSLAGWVVPL